VPLFLVRFGGPVVVPEPITKTLRAKSLSWLHDGRENERAADLAAFTAHAAGCGLQWGKGREPEVK
jgi:hypothetical protein